MVDGQAAIGTDLSGQAPFRVFAIKWSDVRLRSGGPDTRVSTEIKLFEGGAIEIGYAGVGSAALEQGTSATMGIEGDSGTVGVQQSFDQAHLLVVSDSMVRYQPNRDPIADAGEFFGTAKPGATLPLDGTQSVDLDGDVLRFAWRQTSGPATAIVDPTSPKTSAKAPDTSVQFEVRVVDS